MAGLREEMAGVREEMAELKYKTAQRMGWHEYEISCLRAWQWCIYVRTNSSFAH